MNPPCYGVERVALRFDAQVTTTWTPAAAGSTRPETVPDKENCGDKRVSVSHSQ